MDIKGRLTQALSMGASKPMITYREADFVSATDQAIDLLLEARLVYQTPNGLVELAGLATSPVPLTIARLREHLTTLASWMDLDKGELRAAPEIVCKTILGRPSWPFPWLSDEKPQVGQLLAALHARFTSRHYISVHKILQEPGIRDLAFAAFELPVDANTTRMGRHVSELVGKWVEHERAEYRLVKAEHYRPNNRAHWRVERQEMRR